MITIYPQPESFIGKEVDGHRIDAVLGRGGMGIVFKAQNLELSRTVALKIINPALAQDDSFLRRFRSEARALAQIHHPNIVIVYDFRQFDMGFYISMEYVDGFTLADYMEKHGAVPWHDALHLTKQMLSAFHYAHSCGVIHRDIKPRNILLTPNNVVKITDFGLAKILQEGKSTTDTTVTMATGGTIHYMPPEQIRGLRNVDHRGDIFSLGMTIYEAIAGDLPFNKNASGYTIQKMIVEEPFPDLRKLAPDVPKALSRIIMKSLEKEPHKRFSSAAEMISALEEFEMERNKNGLAENGATTSYGYAAAATQRWRLYAAAVGLFITLTTLLALLMPGWFSGSNDNAPPTLAEQVLNQPVNPSINTAQAATDPSENADSLSGQSNTPLAVDIDPGQATDPPPVTPQQNNNNTSNTPASSVQSTGSIRIDSSPRGAEVRLNGRIFGITPLLIDEIELGPMRVELTLDNYQLYAEDTQIEPFNIAQVYGNLNPIQGLLKLNVNPPSALYIDGKLIDRAVGQDYSRPLLAINHEIILSHPQHGQWVRQVDIAAGDSSSWDIDFTKKVRLTVTAFDTENNGMYAEIYLNNKPTGEYTPTPFEIPVGQHRISVRADGFELVDDVVLTTYDQSTKAPLRFTLKKAEN